MPVRQTASANTGESAATITPSDTVAQTVPFRAIWVGVAGNISLAFSDGTSATFVGVPVGMFPMGGIRVNATATTATTMVAIY